MDKRMTLKVGLALFAALLTLAVMLPAAHAAQFVYDLNLSGCSPPGCGSPSFGSVTVTDSGLNTVTLLLTLANSERVINTGLGGPSVFVFNLLGTPEPTISLVGSSTPTGFTLVSGSAGSIGFDGFGNFEYGIQCDVAVCGTGGGAGVAGPVSLTLTDGAGFSAASFAELSTGGGTPAFFAVDIIRPSTGGTGAVASNTQTLVVIPEPGTFVLVGTMLVGLGIWARRRMSGRLQPA